MQGIFKVFLFAYGACFQCGGSGMFIPDPGSDFFPSRIPDPNCLHPGFRIPDPGSSSKNLSILTQKKQKNGCSSRILDPDADFFSSRIPDPESKRHPIPDPGSATLAYTSEESVLTLYLVPGICTTPEC
jgi:hypothetical protein